MCLETRENYVKIVIAKEEKRKKLINVFDWRMDSVNPTVHLGGFISSPLAKLSMYEYVCFCCVVSYIMHSNKLRCNQICEVKIHLLVFVHVKEGD